jgi:hypothetical protein|tara:strand:+ start:9082 stop:9609 length:528 start_codon:yes stop_codon:yes gene_type:complete
MKSEVTRKEAELQLAERLDDFYRFIGIEKHYDQCHDEAHHFLLDEDIEFEGDEEQPTGKRYFLEYITSEIYEDSYEEGECRFTGCGLDKTHIGKFFNTKEEMAKYLADYYGLSEDVNDYITDINGSWETDRQVADHSEAQNGGWFKPTEKEIEQWKQDKIKLYVEHYWTRFHRVI